VKIARLTTKEVEFMPREKEEGIFYLSRRFQLGIHLCACGCRGETVTPLDGASPSWQLTEAPDGVTLRPSIGNQAWPCGSHYWVTNGAIEPCA